MSSVPNIVIGHLITPMLLSLLCCACAPVISADVPSHAHLKPFTSEAEFQAVNERWRKQLDVARPRGFVSNAPQVSADFTAAPAAAPPPMAAKVEVTGSAVRRSEAEPSVVQGSKDESITNVQTVGVDEGGIVKKWGDYLVVLRRGRLFTLRVAGGKLERAGMSDAYAPGASADGAWYDEMLISDNTIVVIGYSYARGGTEVNLFDLASDGGIVWRDTWTLRSGDYFSSRNYASRLIGSKLIFYTPMPISPWNYQSSNYLPGWRRWNAHGNVPEFTRILPATRIYRSDDDLDPRQGLALHTVTSCDLRARNTAVAPCESTAVLGAAGRVFYVSQDNVFVWTTGADYQHHMAQSSVFRIPLSGTAPSMLKTTGSPIDQMSFLQDDQGKLNVLLRSEGNGDGMWNANSSHGEMALMRVDLRDFGDASASASRDAYHLIPNVAGWNVQNRFIGNWLVYGSADLGAGRRSQEAQAYAMRYASSDDAQAIALPHGVERIEALGHDAVLIGNAGSDLMFSNIQLSRNVQVVDRYIRRNAAQSETRSQGFFYKAASEYDGVIGLPIVGTSDGYRRHGGLNAASASVVYLRNHQLKLRPMGELTAQDRNTEDACHASCIDWYGNARPIFIGNRIFALLGYELVEGEVADGRIEEIRRLNFSPRPEPRWGR